MHANSLEQFNLTIHDSAWGTSGPLKEQQNERRYHAVVCLDDLPPVRCIALHGPQQAVDRSECDMGPLQFFDVPGTCSAQGPCGQPSLLR